jgi:AraC-like DNA-binding protein
MDYSHARGSDHPSRPSTPVSGPSELPAPVERPAVATEARALATTGEAVGWLLSALAELGIDRPRLLERAQVGPEWPSGLSEAKWFALWDAAVELSGQSGIGVRLAERLRVEDFQLFGRLLRASSTLGEATLLGTQLAHLVGSALAVSFRVEGNRASLSLVNTWARPLPPDVAEFILATCVTTSRQLTGLSRSPNEVRFAHDAPRALDHQRRVFGVTPRYGGAQNVIEFDSAILQHPVRTSDPVEKTALTRQAERALSVIDQKPDFAHEVRRAIAGELGHSAAQCRRVAGRLGMHPKALTRRLATEGVCYRELVESVRHELAEQYLGRPEARVGEVALLLGFSEKSAFNRAFKRWQGCAPSEYRRRLGLPIAQPSR